MRAALLSKRKGEARQLLGQLISLADDESARENLKALVDGVLNEVRSYTASSGPIRERLVAGTPLSAIHRELDEKLPHWRAFVSDFPDLKLAKEGLEAHEDPALKQRIKELEKKIATGAIPDAIDDWDALGRPETAASGIFVQIMNGLTRLQEHHDSKDWKRALLSHDELQPLLESGEASEFQPGLQNHLASLYNLIRWETLLQRTAISGEHSRRDRRSFLEELFKAKDEIQRLAIRDNSLKDLQERVETAIEEMSLTNDQAPTENGVVKILLIVFVALILVLIGIWFFLRGSGPFPSGSGTSGGLSVPICSLAIRHGPQPQWGLHTPHFSLSQP